MPNFGDPAFLGIGESVRTFNWADWAQWPQHQKTGITPERVLWEATDGCHEKFQMVPTAIINPDI